MARSYTGNEIGLTREEGASSCRGPSPAVLLDSKKQNTKSTLAASSPAPFSKPHSQSNTLVSPPHSAVDLSPACENLSFPAPADKRPPFPAGRYRSPTDSLISPISRGLLVKGRKVVKPSPEIIPPKVLDATYDATQKS